MARRIMRQGRSVRELFWLFVFETNTVLAAADTAALINTMNAALLALRPFTVVRSRGILAYRSDQTGVSENYQAALAMLIVSDAAINIGITAVPTGFSDLGSDLFFVHQMMAGRFEFISGAGFESNAMTVIEYDSKAMRKVNNDSQLAITLETSSLSLGMNMFHAGRILIKLH